MFLLCIMYLFVVIQHGVHALNPQGIYGTIKHHPFTVWCVSRRKLTERVGHNPIGPLMMRKTKSEKTKRKKGLPVVTSLHQYCKYCIHSIIQNKYKDKGTGLPHGKLGQTVRRAVPW